jgi:FkbM family methyltransferase
MKRLLFLLFKKASNALSGMGLWRTPGIAPLWRFLYKVFSPKGVVLITCQGSKMYVNADYGQGGVGNVLLIKDAYEECETELFKKLLRSGMVVVDIGANIGYYTLIAARLVGNGGRVYAFEPESANYELLTKSIEINGYKHVTHVQKAVSNNNGKIKLFVSKISPVHPSFSEQNVPESGGFLEVETLTLDDFFENTVGSNKVDLIKMDTQGAEGLIIDGAEKVLRSNDLRIVMEFWPYGLRNIGSDPAELLYKLEDYGFKIKLVEKADQNPKSVKRMRIIEVCENMMNGQGYVNLLLEK